MTNTEALKALYIALGGDEEDVQDCTTNTEVLNAFAVMYEGDGDAETNAKALENIIAVADNIGGGGGGAAPVLSKVKVTNYTTLRTTIAAYEVIDTKDGKGVSYGKRTEIDGNSSGKSADVFVLPNIWDPDLGTYGPSGYIEINFQTAQAFTGKTVSIEDGYLTEYANPQNNGWVLFIGYDDPEVTPTIKIN